MKQKYRVTAHNLVFFQISFCSQARHVLLHGSPAAAAFTDHIYVAFQCATLALRRSTVSSNSSSQMALLREIYYGAIYVQLVQLTVLDTLVCGVFSHQHGLEVDRINECNMQIYSDKYWPLISSAESLVTTLQPN